MRQIRAVLVLVLSICALAFAESVSASQAPPPGEQDPCSPGYHTACIDQNEWYTTCDDITLDIACYMVYGHCTGAIWAIGCSPPSGVCEDGRVWILCLVDP